MLASFSFVFPFSQENGKDSAKSDYKWKKRRWCAWYSNIGPQDVRHRWIHWVMVALVGKKFDVVTMTECSISHELWSGKDYNDAAIGNQLVSFLHRSLSNLGLTRNTKDSLKYFQCAWVTLINKQVAITQWIRKHLSSCSPRFEYQAHRLCFIQILIAFEFVI